MDYLKRLENSVQNFEAETSKLLRINKLIQDTAALIDAVAKEKEILKKSVAQLESMQAQITRNCETLESYAENEGAARQKLLADIHKNILDDSRIIIEKLSVPLETSRAQLAETCEKINAHCETIENYAENEGAARQKLLADIHKNILDDSRIIIEKLSVPLETSRTQLAETCELISKFIEAHQKSQEIFLSNIESVLIKYNTKNLEVYNNITGTLSNKVDVAENNISTSLNLKLNGFAQDISNLDGKLEKNIRALDDKISGVTEEIKPLQETLSTIKNLILVAIGTGAAACIINFLK